MRRRQSRAVMRFSSAILVLLAACSPTPEIIAEPVKTVGAQETQSPVASSPAPTTVKKPESGLLALGDFGESAMDIERRWKFNANAATWVAARDFTCANPLLAPRIPSSALQNLGTIEETNELALEIWGVIISTSCLETVNDFRLSREAYEALRPDALNLAEIDYLNPYDRFRHLGDFGVAIAELEEKFDIRATEAEWREVVEKNCESLRNDEEYQHWGFQIEERETSLPIASNDHYLLTWGIAVAFLCPELFPENASWEAYYARTLAMERPVESQSNPGVHPASWTMSGQEQLAWNQQRVSSQTKSGNSQGGRIVVCKDGWISSSGGKQGACSWHGGVR